MMGSRFSWQKGHYLKFVNKATQQLVEFEIYDGGIIDNKIILENARVKHKKWETTSDYSDFVQYYEILSKQKHVIEFKSVEESNQLISIKQFSEIEAFDIIEKMYEINKLKSQIIGKLLSNSKDVFEELLNELIKLGDLKNSQILNKILESNQGVNITDTIQILIETYKEIGQPKNQDEILNDVITETNYSMFVSKEESVDTVRILRLLSDAQRHTENLKGKDIIAFFGNTGSGKSTSVNYFMGIPLEKYQNIFGEQVIRIDMKEYENKGLKQTANIGQSIGTSETIYSQGHNIIIEDLNQDVQDTMLCDNPGFLDTRGTDYEICTNLSIDQAIDKCQSIKSIVLVVPFSIFTLDRANHIFSLIYLMKERFPQIMEINSPTNKSFHILITKLANQMQKDGFRDRLNAHITEEQKIISELYQDDRQNIQIGIKKERLNLFIVLLMMLNEDRLKFIDIADQFERDEILQNYLNSNPITKDNYKNAMEGEEMRESFGRQISLSAHTWTSLILKPFLLENPSKSENIKKMIEECNQEIKSYHIDIDDSKKCIESSKDDIIVLENQIIIMEGNLTDDEISKILQSSGLQINENNKSHQIDFIEAKIDIKLQRKKEYEKTIQDTQIQIENLNVKILESDKKIKQWKTGEDKITIIKRLIYLGQVINYQYLDQKKADKAMQNVEDYENGEIKGSYTVGKDQMNLITIQVIHSKYSLVPNKDFDKNDYISKGLISSSQGIFKANIKSRRCQLIAINEKDGGKSIILQYVMNYVPCLKEEDLPYLEISHTIPNSIIFNDSIVNEKSDKDKNEADVRSNQKILDEYEDKIKQLNQEIHEYENEVKEIIEQNKKLQVLKSQQEIIDKYKADLANLKNHIIKLEQNVEIDKKKIIETEKLIQNHDQNQNTLNEKQRRLAFLINDQLRKKIPQSLYKFIDISFKLNDSFYEKSKENGFTKSAKNQNERFLQFKNMYSWHEKYLLASIDSYLQQN